MSRVVEGEALFSRKTRSDALVLISEETLLPKSRKCN